MNEVDVLNELAWLIAGIALLTLGAEWLVRGGSKLGAALGISPMAIGLTIVAFATSTPELFVNINAMRAGQDDIALGNVIGSNLFNVLLILGLCAVIKPLNVAEKLIRVDVPVMIGVSILLYVFCLDRNISIQEGWGLVVALFFYTWGCFRTGKSNPEPNGKGRLEISVADHGTNNQLVRVIGCLGLVVLGVMLLVWGAKLLVSSSVVIARQLGVSELVIALTVVAAGTSLPELATSLVGTVRKEREIAIGNIIGSNIFNILAILGVSSAISDQGMMINDSSLRLDIPFMVLVALVCYPVFLTGRVISRREGLLFVLSYVLYTIHLIYFKHYRAGG